MIKTIFKEHESNISLERIMPYAVRVGDKIEFDDGFIWTVTETLWKVESDPSDYEAPSYCVLHVRIS